MQGCTVCQKVVHINRAILLHGQGEEEAFTDDQHCKATTFIRHL
jgi:hypothetical protein